MGLYDEIKCYYPLPVEGANNLSFQTKDTDAQYIDNYEIREDGTLWHEVYDIEDRSDKTKEGVERFLGCMTCVNKRWEHDVYTGEICFYTNIGKNGWIEFSAHFVDGKLREINLIENTPDTQQP